MKEQAFKYTEHPNTSKYDWRLRAVVVLTERFQSPSGYTFEPGSAVIGICPVEYDSNTYLRFNMPNTAALLLSYSHRLWEETHDILPLFGEGNGTPTSPRFPADDGPLLDLLEKRMAAVVFAYTSIEAFANEVVEHAYRSGYTYSVPNPRNDSPRTLEDIERYMTLEEKLCGVLPERCGVKSPKGTALWQRYGRLRKLRHYIIHPKLMKPGTSASPEDRVHFSMLTDAKFRDFALDARAIMMHYAANGSHTARWLHKCPF